jgi:SAM-dependent methyltransferase
MSIKEKVMGNYTLRKMVFRLTRFAAMNGLPIPFKKDPSKYWETRHTGEKHGPENYVKEDNSTYVTFDGLLGAIDKDASFLEIGCNAGRNLNYLYRLGYRDLTGVEINAQSVHETLRETFPALYEAGSWHIGNAADEIRGMPDKRYDVVFSIAVLEHIPPSDMSLFRDMVRVSRKYIAVITGENGLYDFEKLFERCGCKTVLHRIFYGAGHNFEMPRKPYDERQHFFETMFLRVFIKNDAQ